MALENARRGWPPYLCGQGGEPRDYLVIPTDAPTRAASPGGRARRAPRASASGPPPRPRARELRDPRHLLEAPCPRRGLRGDPDPRAHPGSDRLSLGQRRARRHDLPPRGRVGRRGARVERSPAVHREPGADPRGLDFDVLVRWATTRGQPCHAVTERADATRRIDAILERVRRGEDRWSSERQTCRRWHAVRVWSLGGRMHRAPRAGRVRGVTARTPTPAM